MDAKTTRGCVLCGWQALNVQQADEFDHSSLIVCPRCAIPIQIPESMYPACEQTE